jgi:hypothetical protein
VEVRCPSNPYFFETPDHLLIKKITTQRITASEWFVVRKKIISFQDQLTTITVSIETNENAIIMKTIERMQAIIFAQVLRLFII